MRVVVSVLPHLLQGRVWDRDSEGFTGFNFPFVCQYSWAPRMLAMGIWSPEDSKISIGNSKVHIP